jgi:hypothetical protein
MSSRRAPTPRATQVSGSPAIVTGQARHLGDDLVQPREQRAATPEHDAAVQHVSRDLGRRALQRRADGRHDAADGLVEKARSDRRLTLAAAA